jgi:hypothetical protein
MKLHISQELANWFTGLPQDNTFSQNALPGISLFDVGRCYRKKHWVEQS